MYSVDMAAQRFFRTLGHQFKIFRVLHGRKGPFYMNGGTLHRLTDTKPLLGYDSVVYWGDFSNNPLYAVEDFHLRELYYAGGRQEVRASVETWKQFCLLKGFNLGSRQILSISNNFQSASRVLAGLEPDSASEIAHLLGRFDAIFPRDPASTREVGSILRPDARALLREGIDAAVLNRPSGLSRHPRPRNTFVWFLHRSGLSAVDKHRLVSTVALATGLRPVHLTRWLKMNYLVWDWQFRRMVRQMEDAAFCLSDTYHCLINAMAKDVPVIGLGRQVNVQSGTLGDFKKRELFDMFDLGGQYVETPVDDLSADAIEHVIGKARSIVDGPDDHRLYGTLDRKADEYRQLLASVL